MRETRAVVLGLLVVVLVAMALAWWNRPAVEFQRVKAYRVEVREREGDHTKKVTFTIPSNLVARIAKLAPIDKIGGDIRAQWDRGDVSAKDILQAASESTPEKPGIIRRDEHDIEVTALGSAIEIQVKDDWDKTVRLRLPRAVIESFADEGAISIREILRKLDELGPGDMVEVRDGDSEVTITAEARD